MSNYLEHFKGYEDLIARLEDLKEQCNRYHKSIASNFLNENEVEVAKKYLGNSCSYHIDGGHPNYARAKVIFIYEDDFSDIRCLVAKFNTKFNEINHRDVLGSLINLNLNRNQIGDIGIVDNEIIIYVSDSVCEFIINNLKRIKRTSINFEISNEIYDFGSNIQTFISTIGSMRIDAITASLTKNSRAKAQDIIKEGRVDINHENTLSYDETCNPSDIISIRGYGRFKVIGIKHTTKKDRLVVEFGKFV